jgi:hypothetical protein
MHVFLQAQLAYGATPPPWTHHRGVHPADGSAHHIHRARLTACTALYEAFPFRDHAFSTATRRHYFLSLSLSDAVGLLRYHATLSPLATPRRKTYTRECEIPPPWTGVPEPEARAFGILSRAWPRPPKSACCLASAAAAFSPRTSSLALLRTTAPSHASPRAVPAPFQSSRPVTCRASGLSFPVSLHARPTLQPEGVGGREIPIDLKDIHTRLDSWLLAGAAPPLRRPPGVGCAVVVACKLACLEPFAAAGSSLVSRQPFSALPLKPRDRGATAFRISTASRRPSPGTHHTHTPTFPPTLDPFLSRCNLLPSPTLP